MSGAVTAVPLLKEKKCAQHILCSKTNWAAFYPQMSQNRWVKRWLADIGVTISIPARGKIFPTVWTQHFIILSIHRSSCSFVCPPVG